MPRPKSPKSNGAKEVPVHMHEQVAIPAASISNTEPATNAEKTEMKKTRLPKTAVSKLEKGRSEVRSNVVPINLEDEIRQLAYLLSERRGFEPGHENEDWLRAEQEILQRYRQHSA